LVTWTILEGIYPPMGGATREFHREVLEDALRILEAAGVDYLVIGGVATRSLLGMDLNETEDLDALIRLEDAERLLDVFSEEGYATYRRDPRWIYKAGRPDVTVDLIFRAGGRIVLDGEHLRHSTASKIDGLSLRVPAPEDLLIMKAVFDGEDRQGRWYEALSMMRRLPIDWDYLARRGVALAPRRLLSLLMYAADAGIAVPDRAMSQLVPAATKSTGHERGL
jgi:hypothetical protein